MGTAAAMLDTSPADLTGIDKQAMARCIEESFASAQACTACADACLREPSVAELVTCLRENQDCADICDATGRVLSRYAGQDTERLRQVVQTCAAACRGCAQECERHAPMHEHCRVCAEACRRCEQACEQLLATLR
jgi:hypothetical protein